MRNGHSNLFSLGVVNELKLWNITFNAGNA